MYNLEVAEEALLLCGARPQADLNSANDGGAKFGRFCPTTHFSHSKVENLISGCLPSQINLESEECNQSEHPAGGNRGIIENIHFIENRDCNEFGILTHLSRFQLFFKIEMKL